MKIVFINSDFRVYWKGRLHFLYHFLTKRGYTVNVIELYAKGSPYEFDNNEKKTGWWHCIFPEDAPEGLEEGLIKKKTFEKLDELNPDIVFAGPIPFVAGAISMQWVKKNKKKIIIFDDGKPSLMNKSRLVNFIKQTIIKEADGLLLPSSDYDEEYVRWGIPVKKFYYGFNCVDNKLFKKFYTPSRKSTNKIVCTARLVPVKNLERLLHAWKVIESKNEDCALIIIGNGPDYKTLVELGKEIGVKRVKYLGVLNAKVIARVLANCDAFILPSLSESWGLVVNEAMAAGLPLLLSRHVNAKNTLLKEDLNGFEFDPYGTEEIISSISRFINLTTEEKTAMGMKCQEIIKQFNYKNMAEEIHRAVLACNDIQFKKPYFFANLAINFWNGRNNYKSWNSL